MSESRPDYDVIGETLNEKKSSGMYIREENRHKHYFMMPNIILELELSPSAFLVYASIKRVAGDNDGVCWKSTETMERETGLSHTTIVKVKKELEEKGLIEITARPSFHGEYPGQNITIKNIWDMNDQFYK